MTWDTSKEAELREALPCPACVGTKSRHIETACYSGEATCPDCGGTGTLPIARAVLTELSHLRADKDAITLARIEDQKKLAAVEDDNERMRAVVGASPWAAFLNARLRAIDYLDKDGYSLDAITETLSMDHGQTLLLLMKVRDERAAHNAGDLDT